MGASGLQKRIPKNRGLLIVDEYLVTLLTGVSSTLNPAGDVQIIVCYISASEPAYSIVVANSL